MPSLTIFSVPTEKLEAAQKLVIEILSDVVKTEDIDLAQLHRLLERSKNKSVLVFESSPYNFAEKAIASFTYGDLEGKDLQSWTSTLKKYENVKAWNKSQWIEILDTYLVKNPSVSILGKPSQKLYESQKTEKKERVEHYKTKYGKEGLKELQKKLDAAQEINNKPISEDVLAEFQAPDIEKIKFIKTLMAKAGPASTKTDAEINEIQKIVDSDTPDDFKLDLHFEHYPSQFASINILLSTRTIDEKLMPLLDVFFIDLFSLPLILSDGTELSFEQTVQKLKSDTLSDDIDFGISGQFDDYLNINLQVAAEKYAVAIEWLQFALFRTNFTEERVKIILEKYLNGLPERKRSGSMVVRSSMNRNLYTKRSVRKSTDIFETETYFKELHESLETPEGVKQLQDNLHKIRESFSKAGVLKVLVNGDVEKFKNPVKAWIPFTEHFDLGGDNLIPYTRDVRSDMGLSVSQAAFISPMASSESSYTYVIGKAPCEYTHPDIAVITVCCEFLQAVEGPLWRGVRGAGLAYGANIYLSVEDGLIKLVIYRGTNSGEAINVSKKLVNDYASGATPIEEHFLQGAKNALVHSAATSGESASMVAVSSFTNYALNGRERDCTKKHLEKIAKVTVQDVQNCFKNYFIDLFNPETSMVFIACHTSMTESLKDQLETTGYKVEVGPIVGTEDDFDSDEDSDASSDSEHA